MHKKEIKPYYLHRFIEFMVENKWRNWKMIAKRAGEEPKDLEYVKEYVIKMAKKRDNMSVTVEDRHIS